MTPPLWQEEPLGEGGRWERRVKKDWCWSRSSNTLATWSEELTNCKRPWCWERLKAGGERDDRGQDAWTASPTQWTWVWANFRRWWGTGKPGLLQAMVLAVLGLLQSKSQTWLSNWITTPANLSHVNLIFRQARKTSKDREEFLPPWHSQDVRQGCSHLKVWLGLNEPLPEWLTHGNGKFVLPKGERALFFATWTLKLFECLPHMTNGFP